MTAELEDLGVHVHQTVTWRREPPLELGDGRINLNPAFHLCGFSVLHINLLLYVHAVLLFCDGGLLREVDPLDWLEPALRAIL